MRRRRRQRLWPVSSAGSSRALRTQEEAQHRYARANGAAPVQERPRTNALGSVVRLGRTCQRLPEGSFTESGRRASLRCLPVSPGKLNSTKGPARVIPAACPPFLRDNQLYNFGDTWSEVGLERVLEAGWTQTPRRWRGQPTTRAKRTRSPSKARKGRGRHRKQAACRGPEARPAPVACTRGGLREHPAAQCARDS